MVLDYSERRKIVVDMTDYIKDMLGEFPVKFKDKEKVATVERMKEGSRRLRQREPHNSRLSQAISQDYCSTLTDPRVILRRLWCAY